MNSSIPISAAQDPSDAKAKRVSLFVVIFLFSLIIPLILNLGTIRLSVYRLVLLAMFVPSFFIWISGRAGKILWADLMVILMVAWIALAHIYHFGLSVSIEPIGIVTLENLGAYLLGRSFIRSADAFRKAAWVAFILCMILLPFGIYEAITTENLYMSLWDKYGVVPLDVSKEPRMGLDRFQGPFDHPILSGVFATPILGLACYVLGYQRGFVSTFMLTAVVFVTGFLCVSSGPLSALAVQLGLVIWNKVLGRVEARWWILLVLTIICYVIVDLLSNRKPIVVAISYLALNPATGMSRVNIYHWGWVNIMENPLFGVGNGDWKRYAFMTASFDMFWLLNAMRYGLIAGIGQVGAAMLLMLSIMFTKMPDPRLSAYRMGWLIGITGVIMAGWMVHFWNAPLALYMFVLGSGAWMLEAARKPEGEESTSQKEESPSGLRYSRFEPSTARTSLSKPERDRSMQPIPEA